MLFRDFISVNFTILQEALVTDMYDLRSYCFNMISNDIICLQHVEIVFILLLCSLTCVVARACVQVRLYVVLDTDQERKRSSEEQTSVNGGSVTPDLADVVDAGILVFDTSYSSASGGGGAISRGPPRVLDFRGSSQHCSSLMKITSELVVGREEGVFSYSIEDRGGAAGFEGQKQCITAVGR